MRVPETWRLWFDTHGWWLIGGPAIGGAAGAFVSGAPVTGLVLAGCFVFFWQAWGWLDDEPREPEVGAEQWLPNNRLVRPEPPTRHADGTVDRTMKETE